VPWGQDTQGQLLTNGSPPGKKPGNSSAHNQASRAMGPESDVGKTAETAKKKLKKTPMNPEAQREGEGRVNYLPAHKKRSNKQNFTVQRPSSMRRKPIQNNNQMEAGAISKNGDRKSWGPGFESLTWEHGANSLAAFRDRGPGSGDSDQEQRGASFLLGNLAQQLSLIRSGCERSNTAAEQKTESGHRK